MSKFLHWLVTSSENPNNLALTVKGILGTIVSLVLLVSPIAHFNIDQDNLNAIQNAIIQGILGIAGLVSVIATIVGLIRKIYITGKNPPTMITPPTSPA